jgi:prolyl 4-hydroxylase
MKPSVTSKMDKDVDLPDTTWRTSTQYFLSSKGRPIVQSIDRRVASLTRTRVPQQEFVQVLRYNGGEFYSHHTDYFDKRFYQKDPQTLEMIENGEKNRFITVLWYLTTVEEGGHTIFPKSFNSVPINSSDCSSTTALKVAPVRGEVIIFYNLTPDGGIDPFSLHGACPVIQGTKWAGKRSAFVVDCTM